MEQGSSSSSLSWWSSERLSVVHLLALQFFAVAEEHLSSGYQVLFQFFAVAVERVSLASQVEVFGSQSFALVVEFLLLNVIFLAVWWACWRQFVIVECQFFAFLVEFLLLVAMVVASWPAVWLQKERLVLNGVIVTWAYQFLFQFFAVAVECTLLAYQSMIIIECQFFAIVVEFLSLVVLVLGLWLADWLQKEPLVLNGVNVTWTYQSWVQFFAVAVESTLLAYLFVIIQYQFFADVVEFFASFVYTAGAVVRFSWVPQGDFLVQVGTKEEMKGGRQG